METHLLTKSRMHANFAVGVQLLSWQVCNQLNVYVAEPLGFVSQPTKTVIFI